MINKIEFIFFVENQENSMNFYKAILMQEPVLHVPGMTEFLILNNTKFGLMPCSGISNIVTPILPHPQNAKGIPRSELYLLVDDVEKYYTNALSNGAINISAPENRNWNHFVAYVSDLDGHVIAFAKEI